MPVLSPYRQVTQINTSDLIPDYGKMADAFGNKQRNDIMERDSQRDYAAAMAGVAATQWGNEHEYEVNKMNAETNAFNAKTQQIKALADAEQARADAELKKRQAEAQEIEAANMADAAMRAADARMAGENLMKSIGGDLYGLTNKIRTAAESQRAGDLLINRKDFMNMFSAENAAIIEAARANGAAIFDFGSIKNYGSTMKFMTTIPKATTITGVKEDYNEGKVVPEQYQNTKTGEYEEWDLNQVEANLTAPDRNRRRQAAAIVMNSTTDAEAARTYLKRVMGDDGYNDDLGDVMGIGIERNEANLKQAFTDLKDVLINQVGLDPERPDKIIGEESPPDRHAAYSLAQKYAGSNVNAIPKEDFATIRAALIPEINRRIQEDLKDPNTIALINRGVDDVTRDKFKLARVKYIEEQVYGEAGLDVNPENRQRVEKVKAENASIESGSSAAKSTAAIARGVGDLFGIVGSSIMHQVANVGHGFGALGGYDPYKVDRGLFVDRKPTLMDGSSNERFANVSMAIRDAIHEYSINPSTQLYDWIVQKSIEQVAVKTGQASYIKTQPLDDKQNPTGQPVYTFEMKDKSKTLADIREKRFRPASELKRREKKSDVAAPVEDRVKYNGVMMTRKQAAAMETIRLEKEAKRMSKATAADRAKTIDRNQLVEASGNADVLNMVSNASKEAIATHPAIARENLSEKNAQKRKSAAQKKKEAAAKSDKK